DIGIASVGWGIINQETNEVIDCGVRLFNSADASQNEERRNFRSIRRTVRRKQKRLERINQFLNENQLSRPVDIDEEPINLRCRGLSEQLSKGELYVALYNLAKHRGISYLEDIDVSESDPSGLNLNGELLKEYFPCEIQQQRYLKYGFYRGTNIVDDVSIINTFTTKSYVAEARALLSCQQAFYPFITPAFIEEYIFHFTRKRPYYIGPGNELSRTNYGVYKTDGSTKNNLFDELRGTCSIFNGKDGMESCKRASSASYTAQYYNLLNDLCNIRIDGEKLTEHQKNRFISKVLNLTKAMNLFKVMKELFKVMPDSISGYRINKKNEPEYHDFECRRKLSNFLLNNDVDINKYSIKTLDAISDILTLNTETDAILKYFSDAKSYAEEEIKDRTEDKTKSEHSQLVKDLSLQEQELFIEFRRKNGKYFNKWHNFSYQLMDIIVPVMLKEGHEQHTTITKLKLVKTDALKYQDLKQIPIDEVLDEIYNPIVARSIRQSLRIVNALIKKYDEFSDIVIELAREKNSDEKKEFINKMNKENEALLKAAYSRFGYEPTDLELRNHKQLLLKIKLLYRQDGKCLYSGEDINIHDLINNRQDYEIDHIIPLSISFDDSQSNKVLVKSIENQQKGKQTPYNYLKKSKHGSWNFETYQAYVLNLAKRKLINKKALEKLLFKEDITKQEVVSGFIARNINDTRYSSKVVLNTLQSYFKAKGRMTKVKVVNGSFTHQYRKKYVKLEKDRDLDYAHHGIDALICCYTIQNVKAIQNDIIDLDTGEIKDVEAFSKLDDSELSKIPYHIIRERLVNAHLNMKYSHMVDKKVNRGVSKQTIYGTRNYLGNTHIVGKIDLYSSDNKEIQKLKKLIEKDENIFLMKQHDPKTWQVVIKIIETYKDVPNPFIKYREEQEDKIGLRKYSKKGNGPAVSKLKYIDNKVNSCIDITHKYESKNQVVLLSLKPYRADVYYDSTNDCFNLVPISCNDFMFVKGKYILPEARYNELLMKEKLITSNQTLKDITSNGHEFRFSLYNNDLVCFGDDIESSITWRFMAKNQSEKNRFEVKKVDCVSEGQIRRTFTKQIKYVVKVNTDILGNQYIINKEKLKLHFNVDNDKIL
ncbi:MAG: type II CRISPR RNA-guided endonuclease Cas9, partial [Bacilli bacterium]